MVITAIGSKKNLEGSVFYSYIKDIIDTDEVQSLKHFTHHMTTTRFQHSLNVSYYNYLFCRFFGWDEYIAARAGMMHDLFFYNRKEYERHSGEHFHAKRHACIAYENANELFNIGKIEKDIILKHMWPMTIAVPRYKETFVIIFVDKYCAVLEVIAPKFKSACSAIKHKKG